MSCTLQPFTSADKSGTIFVRQTKYLYHALTQTYKHTPALTTHSQRAHSHSLDGLAASTQALTTHISREDVGTLNTQTHNSQENRKHNKQSKLQQQQQKTETENKQTNKETNRNKKQKYIYTK